MFRSGTHATQLDLSNVQDNVRNFILEYRSGNRNIKQLVSSENLRTREHISTSSEKAFRAIGGMQKTLNSLTREADVQMDQARRGRLLQSLKFPGFNERRNQITEAYEETFHWIFMGDDGPSLQDATGSDLEDSDWEDSDLEDVDLADPSEASWDLFSNWLSSTVGIYWISGKPGSGKTTLVKYVLNHLKTASFLDIWSPRALTISHFFWRPGNEMQQSIKGLLCSLLYQLLDNSEIATNYLLQHIQRARSGAKDDYTDWSVPELRLIFLRILSSYEHPVLIIIDGLDEVHPADGPLELLDLVEQFARCQNTKLCLASRPEPILQRRLSAHPHLRLQDLTRADLDRYARDHIRMTGVIDDDDTSTSSKSSNAPWDLIESIVNKAEGVFLWLVLAIKSINKGFEIGDTTAMIQKRIAYLPGDLTKLYKDMWTRACEDSPETYRQAAALYFRLLLLDPDFCRPSFFPELSVLRLMLVSTSIADRLLGAIGNPLNLVAEKVMLKECRDLERRVESYCFGIVEFTQSPWAPSKEKIVGWYGSQYNRVWSRYGQRFLRFIHRTARDFLLDTIEGKDILSHDVSSRSSLFIRWFKAHLATSQLYIVTSPGPPPPLRVDLVNYVEIYASFLDHKYEELGSCDQNWTQVTFYLERLCNSGQLLSGIGNGKARICGGVDFLKMAASMCCYEYIWPVANLKALSTATVSEILLNLCEPHMSPIPLRSCTVKHGIERLLREGADPNWSGTTLTPERNLRGDYSQPKTPFTVYLESAFQMGRSIMRLEHHRVADILGNLYCFLSCSAHPGNMITMCFQHSHFGDGCNIAFAPRSVQYPSRDHPYDRHIREFVIASFSAHTILQALLDCVSKHFEHPRCREGAKYGEIMALIGGIQKSLDSCPKRDDGRVIGRLGFERIHESHISGNDSQTRKPIWYVPAKEAPVRIIRELHKELGRWLEMEGEDSFTPRRCRIVTQLVQRISWTVQSEGFDAIWESLTEIGILARVDCELHDIQGWVDKFQKQRSADGSFADGIEVGESYLRGANQ